jgi:tetratricopeptide (TPR) repeat protein
MPDMTPGMRIGEPPPFYNLGEYVFQDLCRDLLGEEPGISFCEEYGPPGQKQFGIDILAWYSDGSGKDVGQCKCYEDFEPADIRKASDDFLQHWDNHWSKQGIKRFILFVASEFRTTQRLAAISEQVSRFADIGVMYEAWSAVTIRNKLRPHPAIVRTYITTHTEYWLNAICGVSLPVATAKRNDTGTSTGTFALATLANQLDLVGARLAEETQQHYERARISLLEGRASEASTWVRNVREDAILWDTLSPPQQARLLTFEANLELSKTDGLARAKELADQAQALVPTENFALLRAQIALRTDGPLAALSLLDGQNDRLSLNLKATILLELGQVTESQEVLASLLPSGDGRDEQLGAEHVETLRIQALGLLATGQVEQARLAVQKAMELAPTWIGVRYTAAIVDYFNALAPAILPEYLVSWPSPVEWDFVKRDDTSLERLRAAAAVFGELQVQGSEVLAGEGETDAFLTIWRLACLSNDLERQDAAIAYCRSLLEADPANYGAVLWAVARRFDIDLAPSANVLDEMIQSGKAGMPHVSALFHFLITADRPEDAAKLLEDQRSLYAGAEAELDWAVLHTLALIAQGNTEKAAQDLDAFGRDSVLRRTRALILDHQARETGDWQPLLNHLDASYGATQDVTYLLDACKLQAYSGNWNYVSQNADALIKGLQTVESLRLVVSAAYHTGQFDRALGLLGEYQHLFPQGDLPGDLRLVRVMCQRQVGIISEAIAGAEAVAHDDPTTHNFLVLAQLYFDKGDLWALAGVARQITGRADLAARDALRLADQLKSDYRDLAVQLWRHAVTQGLEDDEVSPTIGLAFNLGLDHEVAPLMGRMMDLAKEGKGGVQLLDIKSVLDMMGPRRNQSEELASQYWSNQLPIHLVADRLNWWLPVLYHKLLQDNSEHPDPAHQWAVMIRYGGHPVPPGFPDQKPRGSLLADITSLLLAAHLGILADIERVFGTIYIPDMLMPTLMKLRDQITPHQRSRPEEYRAVTDIARRGDLRVLDIADAADPAQVLGEDYTGVAEKLSEERVRQLAQAVATGGYVVDFLPLHGRTLDIPEVTLPEGLRDRVINCRTVVDALYQHGPLSEPEYTKALNDLGSEGIGSEAGAIPPAGATLFLHGEIARLLAGANLLGPLCGCYQVYIEQSELDEARVVAEYSSGTGRELTEWLTTLIQRISGGLDSSSGTYALLPNRADGNRAARAHSLDDPTEAGLLTLMGTPTQPGDVVWVDDRLVTSYSMQGVAPIIGICEMLKFLVGASAISLETYYEKLHQLKASNARFIPVEADEIIYQLRQARVEDGKVKETGKLEVLRRYVAACLLPGPAGLQRPSKPASPQDRNPMEELPFLIELRHATIAAIGQLWAEDDLAVAQARAEWVLENLYIEPFDPYPAEGSPLTADVEHPIIAQQLASLLLQVMSIGRLGTDPRRDEAAQRYSEWVWRRVLEPRTIGEPHLLAAIANSLKASVLQLTDALVTEAGRRSQIDLRRALLATFYLKLPEGIRREWDQDTEFMARIGQIHRTVTTIDDIVFDSQAFFRAATKALGGKPTFVTPLEPKKSVKIHPFREGNKADGEILGVWFEHPITKRRTRMDAADTALGLLRGSVSDREAWLRQRRAWFDMPEAEFNQIVAEIAAEDDAVKRMRALNTQSEANAASFYSGLEARLCQHEPVRLVDMVSVNAAGLARHLRLSTGAPAGAGFAVALNGAAHILVQECGAQEALRRLCGLPVPLPRSLLDALASMPPAERREVIHEMLRTAPSPLASVHLLRLLLLFTGDSPAYERLARRLVHRLTSGEGATEFKGFLTLLRWVEVSVGSWEGSSTLAPHLKLALVWAHTHRLFAMLSICGVPLDWVPLQSNPGRYRNPASLFVEEDEFARDVADPFRLTYAPFVLAAIAYGLADSSSTSFEETVRPAVVGATFHQVGERTYPSPDLLRDTSSSANSLNSFLGGEHISEYGKVVGDDAAAVLQPDNLQTELVETIEDLRATPTNTRAWIALNDVLGDLPPSPAVADALRRLLPEVDFKGLFAEAATTGVVAMQVAAGQVRYLDSEPLCSYLESELMGIAIFMAENYGVGGPPGQAAGTGVGSTQEDSEGWTTERLSGLLVEWSYFLAQAAGPGQNLARKWANLLGELVTRWPILTSGYTRSVRNLAWTLPLELARPFWSLLTRLRAEKEGSS